MIPRVAKWRYKRGTRILADSFGNINGNINTNVADDNDKKDIQEEEEEYDIPDEIEDVLDVLFRCMLYSMK